MAVGHTRPPMLRLIASLSVESRVQQVESTHVKDRAGALVVMLEAMVMCMPKTPKRLRTPGRFSHWQQLRWK